MPYLISCFYVVDGAKRRLAIRDVHIEYILKFKEKIALARAIAGDDNAAIGMFISLNVETKDDAENFIRDEPYNDAGLFATIEIQRLHQFIPHQNEAFLDEELMREKRRLGKPAN